MRMLALVLALKIQTTLLSQLSSRVGAVEAVGAIGAGVEVGVEAEEVVVEPLDQFDQLW